MHNATVTATARARQEGSRYSDEAAVADDLRLRMTARSKLRGQELGRKLHPPFVHLRTREFLGSEG